MGTVNSGVTYDVLQGNLFLNFLYTQLENAGVIEHYIDVLYGHMVTHFQSMSRKSCTVYLEERAPRNPDRIRSTEEIADNLTMYILDNEDIYISINRE